MFRTILIALLLIYLVGAAVLYLFQRNLLYFASPEYQHDLETIELINDQQILKILVVNPGESSAIVYFGGNAEPVVFNEVPFAQHFPDHTIYLVNYRGYGGSSGEPTESGLLSDALALYDQIQVRHDSIDAFGRSLGSGVATYLASKRNISRIALVTPYDSIQSVAQARFPIYPISLLIKDKYDSVKRAPRISARVLMIMAELDSIIPNSHSYKLKDAFAEQQVSALTIKGTDHNNISFSNEYYSAIKEFFNSGFEEVSR